ncbi:MAG TPA: diaminopimelate epimerase [Gemmatimonadales bacterium]|nr:diaminopimelate epimerase [Gemmatimonadales bacterium]
MRGTVFYKMSGSGNDFIMLDGRHTTPDAWPGSRIRWICDRRAGVGADGLVILTPERPGEVRMTFFNCDGSRAAMCGNAALCSTRLAAFLELAPADGMMLLTDAGTYQTRCVGPESGAEIRLPGVTAPALGPELVLEPGERAPRLLTVGVPHLVVVVEDVERVDVAGRGRELRFHPALGAPGANVNFVSRSGNGAGAVWRIRTYERGVEGETLACGTGAVAAAVALAREGLAEFPVTFQTRSDKLLAVSAELTRTGADQIRLAGEGRLVFRGVLESSGGP